VAISLSFTGSPIHPPSRCSQARAELEERLARIRGEAAAWQAKALSE
jgi:hypothetical protein